jgi:6-phospho-beta-glucosidase
MAAYMSTSLAIAILGAGSSYMPTLLSQLGQLRTQTPFTLKLYDRVETAQAAATRLADALLPSLPCTAHEDLSGALDGATVVIHLYRAGPADYRERQELKARELGLVGQETQGFGGAASAMCNIAALREIAPHARARCPEALHVIVTNPTGVMTAAATALGLDAVGLCELPYVMQRTCDAICGAPTQLEYVGLNHFAWITGGSLKHGGDCTNDLLAQASKIVAASRPANIPLWMPSQVIALFQAIPSPYLAYYYATAAALSAQHGSPTRAQEVARLNAAVDDALSRRDLADALAIAQGRGGHMLGEALLAFLLAWTGIRPQELILCREPNDGQSVGSVAELPVTVEAGSLVVRRPRGRLHPHLSAMLTTMRTYESLLIDAGLENDLDAFEQALLTHPLVRDASAAHELRLFHERATARSERAGAGSAG